MPRRNLVPTCFLIVVVLSAAYWATAQTPPKSPIEAAAANPFKDKIVTLTSKASPEYGTVIGSVEIKRLGDQEFLVGKGVDQPGEGNWQKGRTIWFAVSDVSQIVEFGSMEELLNAGGER